MNVLKDNDVRKEVLRSKRIAIIGYGSQGQAQALNLRDSGCDVVVGLRKGSASWSVAERAGLIVLETPQAVRDSDVVMVLIPDELQPEVYDRDIGPNLKDGAYLGFAHGFAIHYRRVVPSPQVNVFLAAPNGVGALVRRQYEAGRGVPGMVAVQQDPAGDTRDIALAYAAGIGSGRAGILETTFREETETDLFAEQAVLCGGMSALIRAGFETLVKAGYAPEIAYFSCLHEVKLLADLIHERGIAGMRAAISNTAKYGDLTRGERVIGAPTRQAMKALLAEIQSGAFADEWTAECAAGKPNLDELEAGAAAHDIEAVGRRLRALMPWLGADFRGDANAAFGPCGTGSGFVPAPNQAGPTPGALPAEDRGTALTGDQDPCCLGEPTPVASIHGPGCEHNQEPVDVSGCDWPGFEAPPGWFLKERQSQVG